MQQIPDLKIQIVWTSSISGVILDSTYAKKFYVHAWCREQNRKFTIRLLNPLGYREKLPTRFTRPPASLRNLVSYLRRNYGVVDIDEFSKLRS